jgi:hypothetical protein
VFRQLTLAEVILAAVLCLFAIGTARGGDCATTVRQHEYKSAMAHADADTKPAKSACESAPSDAAAPPAWVSHHHAPTGSHPCRRYAYGVSRLMA